MAFFGSVHAVTNAPMRARALRTLGVIGATATLAASCSQAPTELVLDVYTDVGCDTKAQVAVAKVGSLGDRVAATTSRVCDPATGSLGRLVIVPNSGDSGEVALEVRVRPDHGSADNCLAANNYLGCIVARRIVSYIPGRSISMRVDLKNPCVDTPCSETTTCVAQGLNRACIEAHVDASKCDGQCTDADLVSQSGGVFDPCGAGSNPCDSIATCQVTEQGAVCVCPQGFTHDPKNAAKCVDLDECKAGIHDCDRHATCTNVTGSFTCTCIDGYQGDGRQCEASDCSVSCDPHATCRVTGGNYECVCDAGYEGNGISCLDVDECAAGSAGCALGATCTNTDGSFSCECPAGYAGDGTSCADIDECATGTHDCVTPAVCVNTEGAFRCDCPSGLGSAGSGCADDDECARHTDDCQAPAVCRNTSGGFECDCPSGYEPNQHGCRDLNECQLGTHNCAGPALCVNSSGSFSCQCPAGYTASSPTTCVPIDECATDGECGANGLCAPMGGHKVCGCQMGYARTAASGACVDIDECTTTSAPCGANQTCVNDAGSYHCVCRPGMTLTNGTCVCNGDNLALGATATADSTFPDEGYAPANVVDGRNTTVQQGTESWVNVSGGLPQTLMLEFAGPRSFSRLEFFTSDGYAISDYDIEYYDGAAWLPLVQVQSNVSVHNTYTFSTVTATKLRFICRRGPSIQPTYVRINEVELYCQ